ALPLYASGALKAGEEAARQQAAAARRLLDGSREATVLATTEAYAGSWLAQKLVEVAEARTEAFRLRNREATANFEQGVVTRTDVALTEARAASAEAELARARAQLSAAQARLERLTGLADLEPVTVDAGWSAALPLSEGEALTRALARNPSLAAARAGRGVADARAREVRGSFGPKVSVRARASAGEDIYFFFEDQITDVGAFVRVEVPMFTSGLRAASERQAEAGRSAAMAGERSAELQVTEAVSYLWQDIAAQRLGLAAAIRAEAAAGLAAEGAHKEYEAGIRTLVEALDAETERRNMQAARYGAEAAVFLAEARLLAILNDLGPALAN
ncbi:MAG: TolC family protein, partial [Hyphomonas sp.]